MLGAVSTPLTVCPGYDDVPGDLQLEHFSLDAEPPQKLSLIQRATAMSERKISMLEPGAGPNPPPTSHTTSNWRVRLATPYASQRPRGSTTEKHTRDVRCAMLCFLFC